LADPLQNYIGEFLNFNWENFTKLLTMFLTINLLKYFYGFSAPWFSMAKSCHGWSDRHLFT